MTPPDHQILTAVVYKLGRESPTREECHAVLNHVVREVAPKDPRIHRLLEMWRTAGSVAFPTGTGYLKGNWNLVGEEIARHVREEFPKADVIDVGLPASGGGAFRVVFALQPTDGPSHRRFDLGEVSIGWAVASRRPPSATPQLGEETDIRQVIGGLECQRLGVLLAGSPGWDGSEVGATVSKNRGHLAATCNDCNVMLHQILALSREGLLRGTVSLGVVQTRKAFLVLLRYIVAMRDYHLLPSEADREALIDRVSTLYHEEKFTGVVATDAQVSGSITGGIVVVKPGGVVGAPWESLSEYNREVVRAFAPLEAGRFVDRTRSTDVTPYILIHYSGHGAENGDIQIEQTEALSPEELVDLSNQLGVPFVLVLDMCHGSRFGDRFVKRLEETGGSGLAMTANDDAASGGLTFESVAMTGVRWFSYPVWIGAPDWTVGRGVFTSAFALGLSRIQEGERAASEPYHVSVREFNDAVLGPICEEMVQHHGVPLIRPSLYSCL